MTFDPAHRCLVAWLMVATGLLLVGCISQDPAPRSSSKPVLAAGRRRVEMMNLSTRTPALDARSTSPAAWVERFRELRDEPLGRRVHGVRRFPDISVELLRNPVAHNLTDADCALLAEAYDIAFCRVGSGWSAAYRPGLASPNLQMYLQERSRILSLIEQGRLDLAAQQHISEEMHPFLRAECLRLRGVAQLLADQPAEALSTWQGALQLTAGEANASAELTLLACDALRRSGGTEACRHAWTQTVLSLGPIADPILWQRAIELRPEGAPWPAGTGLSATRPAQPATTELVWLRLGQWRLARSEYSPALLAFARVDSTAPERQRGEARIGQAKALLALNQPGPATSTLAGVAASSDAAVARHAAAVIAVARIESGDLAGGLQMLNRAVDSPGERWPDYFQAVADLGLAHLMQGNEAEGLKRLREAQDAWRSSGEGAALARSFENEARYHEKRGQQEAAGTARMQSRGAWDSSR